MVVPIKLKKTKLQKAQLGAVLGDIFLISKFACDFGGGGWSGLIRRLSVKTAMRFTMAKC